MDTTFALVLRGIPEDIEFLEDVIEDETTLEIIYRTAHMGKISVTKE